MPLRRFFVPRDAIRNGTAVLAPAQAHHLRHVLRLNDGDDVEIFDGEGTAYLGQVEISGSDIRIIAVRPAASPQLSSAVSIALAASVVRPERFEWILQKATELGVDDIVPLHTRHSSIRIPVDRMHQRLERWRRISAEAARQCCRNTLPAIHAIRSFPDFLAQNPLPEHAKFLCDENSGSPWHQGMLGRDRTLLCVGPEGGWDAEEIDAAAASGFTGFSLGPQILRAETAALVAVTLFRLRISETGIRV